MPEIARAGSPLGSSLESPLESLGRRFGEASRARSEGLLRRHGHRLTTAERLSYAAQLQQLHSTHGSGITLRRRLLDRLLRAAALRRRSRDWKELDSLETASPRGPYNDRAVLEETLRRTALSDPEWTREFLDLYARLGKLQTLCRNLLLPSGTIGKKGN